MLLDRRGHIERIQETQLYNLSRGADPEIAPRIAWLKLRR